MRELGEPRRTGASDETSGARDEGRRTEVRLFSICGWGGRDRERSRSAGRRGGEDVGAFVREVFKSDDVLLQLRAVQAIVT
jgi:hypothetical protein